MFLLNKLWGYLAGFCALVVGFLGFAAYFKHQGKKDEQAADTERALQQSKEANDISQANRNLSDAAARDKLRHDQRD